MCLFYFILLVFDVVIVVVYFYDVLQQCVVGNYVYIGWSMIELQLVGDYFVGGVYLVFNVLDNCFGEVMVWLCECILL